MGAPISIVDGEYKINSGGWTAASGTVVNGDNISVRRLSSGSYDTEVNCILTVGTYSTNFSITTKEEESFFEVTTTYGIDGNGSVGSCTVGTETETLYTKNEDGVIGIGDWFYKDDGMGGKEVFYTQPFPIGTDTEFYWISYFEAGVKIWVKLAYDSGVYPDSGDLVIEKGVCATGENYFISLQTSTSGTMKTVRAYLKDIGGALVTLSEDVNITVQFSFIEVSTGDPIFVTPTATLSSGTSSVVVYDYDSTEFTFVDQFILAVDPNPVDGHNLIFA